MSVRIDPAAVLDRLLKHDHIDADQHAAGLVFARVARRREYPGIAPTAFVLAGWSPRLRRIWSALAGADAESRMHRPPKPTASSVVWGVAGRPEAWPRWTQMRRWDAAALIEREVLRHGLSLIADTIARHPEDSEAEDDALTRFHNKRSVVQGRARFVAAELLAGRWPVGTRKTIAANYGVQLSLIRDLRAIGQYRLDLLPKVATGELSVSRAAELAKQAERPVPSVAAANLMIEIAPAIDGRRVKGAAKRKATGGYITGGNAYYAARLKRDRPDLAARVAAGEFPSIRAACVVAGWL